MARSPSGVAALSRPSVLAAMFMKMLPVAGWPLGMSGKSLTNTGLSSRDRASTTPPFSPIFIMPSHSESTPVRPSEISNAVFDDENVESIMAGNTSVSPMNTSLTTPMANAIRKKSYPNVVQNHIPILQVTFCKDSLKRLNGKEKRTLLCKIGGCPTVCL